MKLNNLAYILTPSKWKSWDVNKEKLQLAGIISHCFKESIFFSYKEKRWIWRDVEKEFERLCFGWAFSSKK